MAFLIAAAVGLILFNPSASQAQAKGPIKIGYIAPLTGAFAENRFPNNINILGVL